MSLYKSFLEYGASVEYDSLDIYHDMDCLFFLVWGQLIMSVWDIIGKVQMQQRIETMNLSCGIKEKKAAALVQLFKLQTNDQNVMVWNKT